LARLSARVDARVEDAVRTCEYLHRVSKSAVVEIALLDFFARRGTPDAVGSYLKGAGASQRRR
jgi:hypothetical protein